MASSSSGVAATLSRWRPAILVVIGFGAAYGVYQVHTALYSIPVSQTQSGLRRRNAVHRSNFQRNSATVSTNPDAQNDPVRYARRADALARNAIENLETVYLNGRVASEYGTVAMEADNGVRMAVLLHPRMLPSRDQLRTAYSTTDSRVEAVRNALENEFLDVFLRIELPPGDQIHSPLEEQLVAGLSYRDIDESNIRRAIRQCNSELEQALSGANDVNPRLRTLAHTSGGLLFVPGPDDQVFPEQQLRVSITEDGAPHDNLEHVTDAGLDDNGDREDGGDDQELLGLLFNIAEDKARRDGYVHRGVTCNSCDMMPIRGIRYRCSNCLDYDLCETCEAQQVHYKTHLLYKVRIPAPFIGNPRQAQPVCYPGKPSKSPNMIQGSKKAEFKQLTAFELTELDGLWDQFRCLAATEWPLDPHGLGMAIDRKTFDKCFIPSISVKPPPPNLLYDRMFAYYDTNNDGLIGFEEFITGLASLRMKTSHDRTQRIFNGYDLDADGYIDRRDVLRMFRAFYALSKELSRDSIVHLEEEYVEASTARELIEGSQPLSSAFTGPINPGETSRFGDGKHPNTYGDLELLDDIDIVRENEEDKEDPHSIIADAAQRKLERSNRHQNRYTSMILPESDSLFPLHTLEQGEISRTGVFSPRRDSFDGESQHEITANGTHSGNQGEEINGDENSGSQALPGFVTLADIETVLGHSYVLGHDISSFKTRLEIIQQAKARIMREETADAEKLRHESVKERWRRRQFYIDEEEGMKAPEGYDLADDVNSSQVNGGKDNKINGVDDDLPPSATSFGSTSRSRSSSKVRFEDELSDAELETRSNGSVSSRSIPVGERWGGYEIPVAEKDAGKEFLYQVTQQALNEILDPVFEEKETLAMNIWETAAERKKWANILRLYSCPTKFTPPLDKAAAEELRFDVIKETKDLWASLPNLPPPPSLNDHQKPLPTQHDRQYGDTIPMNLEQEKFKSSLEDVLWDSGFFTKPDGLFDDEESKEPRDPASPDPTLPQNRPDSISVKHKRSSSEYAFVPAGKIFSKRLQQPLPDINIKEIEWLNRLLEFEVLEKELDQRGGGGKISLEEFETFMNERRELGFLGNWIEMGNF